MSSRFRNSAALVALLLAAAACEREKRDVHAPAPAQAGVSPTTLTTGGEALAVPKTPDGEKYEKNAFQLSEGKRYYEWYNCYGCHAAGGGDIGPPLMDERWIYGGEIEQIAASIAEGRPNGMPSFRKLIPEQQIWQIAGYVRSLGGLVPKAANTSRGDELQHGRPLNQVEPTPPQSVTPPRGPK
jgi:cytochrome c oxidase cbb3-type subunit 3